MIKELGRVTGPYLDHLLASTEAAAKDMEEALRNTTGKEERARYLDDLNITRANQSLVLDEQGKRIADGVQKLSQDMKYRGVVTHG